ncbi:autotransporter outer membrane beta-barrel domain-containing protein, partial [Salmonella enterica]|uniref:autotransporter outer membrane beta-barrel domain-containing protein n=1 Tax=Salmonella enterica TaxID=28901 RepID=UPI00344F76B9
FFAEPYVRAAARAFDGEHYALSNGMTVNNNDYKSMLGEVGADLGYIHHSVHRWCCLMFSPAEIFCCCRH